MSWSQVAIIIAGFIIAKLYQTRHLDRRIDNVCSKTNSHFDAVDKRFDDLIAAMDKRFDDLKDWIRSEVQRLEERIDRVEHPVQRP